MAAQPDMQRLNQGLQQMGQGFQAMSQELTLIGNIPAIAGGQAILAAIQTLDTNLSQRLTTLDNRLTALDNRVTALDTRVTTLDTNITQRLASIENQIRVAWVDFIDLTDEAPNNPTFGHTVAIATTLPVFIMDHVMLRTAFLHHSSIIELEPQLHYFLPRSEIYQPWTVCLSHFYIVSYFP